MGQMQILWRLIVRPLRRSNIATSPASVRRLVCTSQPVLCSMASGTPRSWSSALARRVSPRFAAANPPTCRVSRFDCGSRNMASSRGVKEDQRRARVNIISCDEDAFRTAMEVMDSKPDTTGGNVDKESWAAEIPGDSMDYVRSPMDILPDSSHCDGSIYSGMPGNVYVADCELSSDDRESWAAEIPGDSMDYVPPPMYILPHSSHRDGSIYSGTPSWKRDFLIADRTETRLEAMMFSHPTDCGINGVCRRHHTRHMLQIFSLKLANIPMERGPIELYGYIAARDNVDRLLNYVINFSREDPIIVEQGSLIDMAGPKRGIKVVDTTLIEFDMKIKAGRHEKQDLQLIDGVSFVDDIDPSNCSPFTYRIHGDCGAIDITAARLNFAVEATMEVAISQVQGGFSMRMGCFTSGIHKEIRLFDGAITESRGLKRAVIAVAMGDQMDLKFKVAADSCIPAEHCCSFKAARHGRATQEIKTEFALIAVKVTWSTLV